MQVSVILATAHGAATIATTLASLASVAQLDKSLLEVVIIDQSFDHSTFDVVVQFESRLHIVYVHALKKGLSHSRNIGLDLARGDVVCFGDDDCTYSERVFGKVCETLARRRCELVGVSVVDPQTMSRTRYTRSPDPGPLSMQSMGGRVTSVSIFLLARSLSNDLRFNEHLGLGAEFESCEEIDLVHRFFKRGNTAWYEPELAVYHLDVDSYSPFKTKRYAAGHGAFTWILLTNRDLFSLKLAAAKMLMALARWPAQLVLRRGLHPGAYNAGFWRGFFGYRKLRKENNGVIA